MVNRGLTKILTLTGALVLASCSKLVSSSGTNDAPYAFPGAATIGVLPNGAYALSWQAVPDSGVVYSVFSRRSNLNESFDFSADPLMTTTETVAETEVFPLNETRCFVVRAKGKNYTGDKNKKEVCATDGGVSDFLGVSSASSVVSGQVTVSWVKSADPSVVGYRIYQGSDFGLRVGVAGAEASSLIVTNLPPGERREFGVRAFDKNGREDDNTKTASVVVSDALAATGDFLGCVSATALDTSNILVQVAFPAGAGSMTVLRDGLPVADLPLGGATQYLDSGLSEGKAYQYTCRALINGVAYQGTNTLDVTTLSVNPPTFAGVSSTTAIGGRSLRVVWGASSGVSASTYKVWVQRGTISGAAFDFEQTPTATVSAGALETIVTGLGDELTYTVAVRACSASGICDTNQNVISKTLPDAGAPITLGATAVAMVNGNAQITVPWDHSKGAVKYRQIYMRSGSTGGTTISNYTLLREELVSDVGNPPTTILITGLAQNSTYHFIVRDKDPSGNVNANTNFVSVSSGDLTAPVFGGITALNAGTSGAEDTTLIADFIAVAAESGAAPDGPSYYLVYKTSDGSDPCGASVPVFAQIAASGYSAGQTVSYTLTGLSPRTQYKVCVKARDAATNVSATSASLARTTRDITPPVFAGIQTISYTTATSILGLTWNAAYSPTSDLSSYVITLWKNNATPTNPVTITKAYTFAGISSGISLTNSDFPMSSNDTVYAYVNACDNAAPLYASADNCTLLTTAKSTTLPDIVPPPGFTGISAVSTVAGTSNLLASWNAPADWSDYRGFKVFSVAENATTEAGLTFVKDCYCSANGCPLQETSCTISGLDARRTYNFYVRAFDAAGNLTAVSSPWASRRSAQTLDVSPPVFTSSLNAVWQPSPAGILITYSAATDNQYASEPGAAIAYRIYRKVDATFANATNPSADGTLIPAAGATSFLDVASNLLESHTYYYAVCAVDASSNATCDGSVRNVTILDYTPPTFTGGITSLTQGSPSDTKLVAGWTAITPEGSGAGQSLSGATDYRIYTSDASHNPCSEGALAGTELAASHATGTAVTYTITGLTQRTTYRVCVKARDAALNESATTAYLSAATTDITPPTFLGAQTALYDAGNARINVTWNTATSDVTPSDVASYMISVWNAATPGDVTVLTRTAASSLTGTNITSGEFAFASNSTVKVLVNACDTYTPVPNCSQIAASEALAVTIPDTTPPTGFFGLSSVAALSPRSTSNGSVVATWTAPLDWTDYSGFNIYGVIGDDSTCSYGQANNGACLTLLKACSCAQSNCSDHLTSCTVGSLPPGRTYYFYARAFDAVGNQSTIESPNAIAGKRLLRVPDLVAPTFASSLNISWNGSAIGLTWSPLCHSSLRHFAPGV